MAGGSTAKLTLQLVDGVSGPARNIAGALRGVNNTIRGISSVALAPSRAIGEAARGLRNATYNIAPAGAALGMGVTKMATDVYNMQKELNVSVAAGGLSMDQRNAFMAEAIRLNGEYAATASEIVQAGNQLLRAGLNYDQMMGSLPGVLSTAQAMGVPMEDASRAVVDSMVSMRMAMEDTQSTMASSIRMADLYAHAVNETTGELDDFATSSKYFNPVAASMGMSPEEAMALQIALAKAGIKGSSAGTGLRAAPVRIAAPSPKAMEAMGRLGIDPSQFVNKGTRTVTGGELIGALEGAGFSAEGVEAAIDALIADPAFKGAPAKLANEITRLFGEQLGIATAEDQANISQILQQAILAGGSEVDLIGFLKEMQRKGAGVADYAQIIGLHHASKMQAIDPKMYDQILADVLKNAPGTSMRMREAMMAGIVGDVAEFTAAIEKMSIAIGDSGLLSDASKAISALASSISELADTNPDLLRFGSYAALALASLPALGFAAMGAGAALSLLVNPLAWLAAAAGTLVALNFGTITDAVVVFGKSAARAFDPALVERVRSAKDAFVGFLTGGVGDPDAIGQTARNMGIAFADGINTIYAAIPRIQEIGASMLEFGQGAWKDNLPAITSGIDSLKEALGGFAGSKVDAFTNLGTAIADFAERALPHLQPAAYGGVAVIASSFQTLASGFGAVGRVIGGVTEGFVSFATALYENIDSEALASIGNGLSSFMENLRSGLEPLRKLFNAIDLDLSGFASNAGALVGQGISAIVNAFANGKAIITAVWDTLKALFAEIGTYVPDFSGIINAVSNFAGAIAGAAQRVAAAIARMAEAIRNMPSLPGGIIGGPGISNVPARASPGAAIGAMVPKKAAGGAIRRGLYEVGERGPEVVSFGSNGYVTPNHRLGGGGNTITNHFNIRSSDPQAAAREVMRILDDELGRSGQIAIDR